MHSFMSHLKESLVKMEPLPPASLRHIGSLFSYLYFFLFDLDHLTQCTQFVTYSTDSENRNSDYHLDKMPQTLNCLCYVR